MEDGVQKIKSIGGIKDSIRESNETYVQKIKTAGGYGVYFRALVAQILWLTFMYIFAKKVIPVKNVFLSNALLVIFLTIFSFLWSIIKKKLPPWIDEYVRGEVFYKFDISLVNYCIIALLILIAAFSGYQYIGMIVEH